MAGRGYEIDRSWERTRRKRRDDDDSFGVDGDLARAATAGQADFGLVVRPDDGRVDVAVPVDLSAAKKSDLNSTALQVQLKDIRHRSDRQRIGDERRIPDGDWKPIGHCAHRAGFVNEHE